MFSITGSIKSVNGYFNALPCLFAENYLGSEEKLNNKFTFIFHKKSLFKNKQCDKKTAIKVGLVRVNLPTEAI